jgi:hypothetical protein
MTAHWRELVSTAMLGTDRRDPPEPEGLLADLVDDTLRSAPSERMLAQVAACTAVLRAGVRPAPPVPRLQAPASDDRPVIALAAADRWHHITVSWPVLEDEWVLTLIANGWRVAPELVPAMLRRHRRDPVRRARAEIACGPLAAWLVELVPDLAAGGPASTHRSPSEEDIAELASLPIPPELEPLLHVDGARVARRLVGAIDEGMLAHAHRAVLVNLVARMRRDALGEVASTLEAIDGRSIGFALAAALGDLARTRQHMLDELSVT